MRPLEYVATSRDDLRRFPDDARQQSGYALELVQAGAMPENAKPLQGFGGAGVQEIAADDRGGTFRVVYTVTLPNAVYVLHAFQKKSTSGVKTSQRDIDLVRQRLRVAQMHSDEAIRAQRKEAT